LLALGPRQEGAPLLQNREWPASVCLSVYRNSAVARAETRPPRDKAERSGSGVRERIHGMRQASIRAPLGAGPRCPSQKTPRGLGGCSASVRTTYTVNKAAAHAHGIARLVSHEPAHDCTINPIGPGRGDDDARGATGQRTPRRDERRAGTVCPRERARGARHATVSHRCTL
jgi:hypothetical protein